MSYYLFVDFPEGPFLFGAFRVNSQSVVQREVRSRYSGVDWTGIFFIVHTITIKVFDTSIAVCITWKQNDNAAQHVGALKWG